MSLAPPPIDPSSSSAYSSTEHLPPPVPTMGSKRERPPQPPQPLFYVDQSTPADTPDEARRDPFRTPDVSVPGTPKSGVSNPFSAPSSVVSFSAEQMLHHSNPSTTSVPGSYFPNATPSAPHSRPNTGGSRVSVRSALRNSTTDLHIREVRSRRNSATGHAHTRSSFMSPPALPRRATVIEPDGASAMVPRAAKRARSSMLMGEVSKPWLTDKDVYGRLSYWLTYLVAMLGVVGAAIRVYFSWAQLPQLGNMCLVMEDNFDTFDTENTWFQEVDMGGFGNGEFEMTTASPNNSFVQDGHLYLVPTLTSDIIGRAAVLDGYTFNLTGCTSANASSCGAVSNITAQTVIPPVMSARISTINSHHIAYGRVEISAKLPRGDWIWPALWMLPVQNVYGPWPASGEIDIMEARGNPPEYAAQGVDYVRGSLNWGPFSWLNGVSKTFGWWTNRRKTFADAFHTYALEWTPQFIRIYVDSRLTYMLYLPLTEPFFARGDFPPVVANGSEYIVLEDPWRNGTRNVAPFDEEFYLIVNVAVGGTSGWFPDGVGGKPWLDASLSAMSDFAHQQDEWYATWPTNIADRALVVDYVKMWQRC